MRPAGGREPAAELTASEVNVVLVAPAAVDVDAAQRPEAARVTADETHRVVLEPPLPARLDEFAGLALLGEVFGDADLVQTTRGLAPGYASWQLRLEMKL